MRVSIFASLLYLYSNLAYSANYYVSPTGNDLNPGTIQKPWKTPVRAFNKSALKAGDTVYFRQGDYYVTNNNTYLFVAAAGGTATAPITFRPYGSEIATIVWNTSALPTNGARNILSISKPYVVINGLNFRQTETSRRLSMIDNTRIQVNGVSKPYFSGIHISGLNTVVRNCAMDNLSGHGVTTAGENTLVEGCTFTRLGNHVFYIAGKAATIRNNSMDGSRATKGQRNIQIQYVSATKNKIYGNLIKNGQYSGLVFSGGVSYNEVFNNVFVNSGSSSATGGTGIGVAVDFWCEKGPMGAGNRFYNNTLIGKTVTSIFYDPLTPNCQGVRPISQVDIRENIFYPSQAKKLGLYSLSMPKIRGNIFYNTTGSVPSGNKSGVNPLLVNPLGTTAASANLKSGSPAINAGTSSIYPKFDFYGHARPTRYDLGAFEFGATGSTPLAPQNLQIK